MPLFCDPMMGMCCPPSYMCEGVAPIAGGGSASGSGLGSYSGSGNMAPDLRRRLMPDHMMGGRMCLLYDVTMMSEDMPFETDAVPCGELNDGTNDDLQCGREIDRCCPAQTHCMAFDEYGKSRCVADGDYEPRPPVPCADLCGNIPPECTPDPPPGVPGCFGFLYCAFEESRDDTCETPEVHMCGDTCGAYLHCMVDTFVETFDEVCADVPETCKVGPAPTSATARTTRWTTRA